MRIISSGVNHNNDVKTNEMTIVIIQDNVKGIDNAIKSNYSKFCIKTILLYGIGISICKNIVGTQHGQIWTNNDEDTKNISFSFSLPTYLNK